MNIGMESLEVSPQARDQSNRVPTNNAMSWSPECFKSLITRLLHSLQITHITHNSTMFQIFYECFPTNSSIQSKDQALS